MYCYISAVDVAVVIVNWNSGPFLSRCLESISSTATEFSSVKILDNVSEDGSWRTALDRPGIELVRLTENFGFAGAANRGIVESDAPFILLLNPDVEIRGEVVSDLLEGASSTPRAAISVPLLVGPSNQPQQSFQIRRIPTLRSVLSDVLFLDEIGRLFGPRSVSLPLYRKRVAVEQPAAACWLLRREAWDELGGFDERFHPAWFEDVDFCKRLLQRGWKNYLWPGLHAVHHGGHTLPALSYRRFLRIYYKNLLRYWKKHHPSTLPLVWLAVQVGLGIRLLGKGR